jgi:hypothetical protein
LHEVLPLQIIQVAQRITISGEHAPAPSRKIKTQQKEKGLLSADTELKTGSSVT